MISAKGLAFREPDWHAPVDLNAYLAAAPPHATVKGIFFNCAAREAFKTSGKTFGRPHYPAFKSYPVSEWLEHLYVCAQAASPKAPVRKALFEMGGHVYDAFATSTIGGVVLGIAGGDFRSALRLVTRAYHAMGSASEVLVAVDEPNRAVVSMRDMAEFVDSYQAGILAAGARRHGVDVRVRVRSTKLCDCDIELSW